MRRFVVRFLLGIAAAWIASALLPGIKTDGQVATFILLGLFLGVGEVVIPVVEGGAAVILFFLPRSIRVFALRGVAVAVAASLTAGFGFSDPLVGVTGLTVLLSLLYLLPPAS